MKTKRKWNSYEMNQLLKYGFDPFAEYEEYIPVEYITNKVEFFGKEFYVDKNVLIPRPETEGLIKIALNLPLISHETAKKGKNSKQGRSSGIKKKLIFADIGTGSGVIGITLAFELKKKNIKFKGYLTDVSLAALSLAQKNWAQISYPLPKRESNLTFLKSDLLTNVPKYLKFDLILANLPYIPESRKLDPSVSNFEPNSALFGGKDGLDYIRQLLTQSKSRLKKNGFIILEVDDTHNEKISKEFKKDYKIDVLKDENGKNRYWGICLTSNTLSPILEKVLLKINERTLRKN